MIIYRVLDRDFSIGKPEGGAKYRAVSDAPIFIAKTLRLEFLGLVCLQVTQDCPETFQSESIFYIYKIHGFVLYPLAHSSRLFGSMTLN